MSDPLQTWAGLHTTQDPGGAIQNTSNPQEEGPWTNVSYPPHFSSKKRCSSMSGPLQKKKKNPISSNARYNMMSPFFTWEGLHTTQHPGGAIQNMPNAEEEGPWTNVSFPLLSNDTRSSSDALHTWAGLDTTDPDAIRNILNQEEEEPWTNVSDLRGYLAQDVVNFLQSELDDVSPGDTEYRAVCVKCLHALSFTHTILPSQLCLLRTALIKREYRNSRSSGNNYHYCALIRGPRLVCLTRFRPLHGRDKDYKSFMQTALTWRQLQHDNILPLDAVSTELFSDIFSDSETFCFITPWMRRGNALDYLRENPKHDRRGWVRDIAAAIQYLHNLDPCIIHGDIKAENVLIRDDLCCYLSGFWEQQSNPSQSEYINIWAYESANDIYLFGLTIIELYTGQRKVVYSPPPEAPSNLWDKIVLPCMNPVSDHRPSAHTIVNTLYRHYRAHLRDYEAGKHAPAPIEDHSRPAEDFLINSDSDEIPMWIAAAYLPPKLHDATSKLLQERLKQLEPWKDIGSWACDYRLDVQSVMDELQMELDQVTNEDSEHRRKCVKCLHELSRHQNILPSQLYISEASFDLLDNTRVGGGGFSDVHKASIMGRSVCVKSLRVHQAGPYSLERMKKVLRREALIWRQTTHANILPFYGISTDITPSGLCFISPWMAHGNIRQYLNAHSMHDPFGWVLDVAAAMQYLHSLDPCIIHKDIRGVNILVGDDLRAYLSDFGISLVVETHVPGTSSRGAGNVRWLPPELISVSEGSQNAMKEWDIYSFGCMVLEMYTRQNPYSELNNDGAVIGSISKRIPPRQPPPDILPTSLWEAVVAPCLSSEPDDRPSANAILHVLISLDFHPFTHIYPWPQRRAASLKYFKRSDLIDCEMNYSSSGFFSNVYHGTMSIQGHHQVVCLKQLKTSLIGGIRLSKKTVHAMFSKEAFIWQHLEHENILPLYGVSKEIFDYPENLCLILPWMEYGTIRDFLNQHPNHDRIRMIWDIVSGLKYLHEHNPCIIHKDIQAANILVGPKPHHRCYLADFGSSLVANTEISEEEITSDAVPVRWMAPELSLRRHKYNHNLLCRADIYSLGCTILEIYAGRHPLNYIGSEWMVSEAVLRGIRLLQPPSNALPPELWTTIVLPCLSPLPQARPSATAILKKLEELNEPSLVEYLKMIKQKPAVGGSALGLLTSSPDVDTGGGPNLPSAGEEVAV